MARRYARQGGCEGVWSLEEDKCLSDWRSAGRFQIRHRFASHTGELASGVVTIRANDGAILPSWVARVAGPPSSFVTAFVLSRWHGWLVHPCSNPPRFLPYTIRIAHILRIMPQCVSSQIRYVIANRSSATYGRTSHPCHPIVATFLPATDYRLPASLLGVLHRCGFSFPRGNGVQTAPARTAKARMIAQAWEVLTLTPNGLLLECGEIHCPQGPLCRRIAA